MFFFSFFTNCFAILFFSITFAAEMVCGRLMSADERESA